MPERTKKTSAAALRYDKTRDAAPKLAAKGRGQIAEKIIELARESGIPIRQDANLLTVLEKLDLEQEIPLEIYAVVAEIFAYLYKTGQNKQEATS